MSRSFNNDQSWAHKANQRVAHAKSSMQRRGGWRPSYWFQQDPGEDIRFFRGSYGSQPLQINYQIWVPNPQDAIAEKRRKQNKNPGRHIPCNCNAGALDASCVPCKIIADHRKKNTKAPYFMSVGIALNLIVLKNFHKVKIQSGDKEYTRYEKCTAELGSCEYCDENAEMFFGNTTYVNAMNKEWNQLMGFQRQIAYKCRACANGVVVPVASKCPNCGREAEYPTAQLLKMEAEEAYCDACGFNGTFQFAKECMVHDRQSGDYKPGCGHPTSLGLFDVNMRVLKRKTSDTKGADGKMRAQYQLEMPNFDIEPLSEELEKKMKYPMDFSFLMRMEASEQAEVLGVENPFKGIDTSGLPEVHAGQAGFQGAPGMPMSDTPIPTSEPAPNVRTSRPMTPPPTGAQPIPTSAPTPVFTVGKGAPDPDPAPQDTPKADPTDLW